jgi:hypothetical protein
VTVERSLANSVTLEEKSDLIELGNGIDELRLVDIENGAETWTLVLYSVEWDANNVAPTLGGDLREGDDNALISGLIGEVPSWSAGTINDLTGPLSFVFNHAQRHEALRRIERNVPGELKFRDAGTVDYLSRLGSDKSGSVELSNTAGTIEEEINITKRGRELDGTHIRVLGAHEGEAQLFANLVPSDDSATYENRVDYTTSRWSDGDTRDWDRWENKDVTDQATIEEEAAALGEELKETLVEAKATTPDLDIQIGDTVQVVKSDADLDRAMRIHRLKEMYEGATKKLKLLLSTRTTLRTDDSADLRDIQRFNTGFQGSSVAVNGGPVIGALDSTNPLTFGFRYPDLEFENTATLRVRGESYRVDSQPKSHSHDVTVTHPSHDHDVTHPSHDHDVDILSTTDAAASGAESASAFDQIVFGDNFAELTFDLPLVSGDAGYAFVTCLTTIPSGAGDATDPLVQMFNVDKGTTFYDQSVSEVPDGETRFDVAVTTGDVEGDTINVEFEDLNNNTSEIRLTVGGVVVADHDHTVNDTETSDAALGTNETSTAALGTTETSTSDTATGQEPGIFTTADTPSNVGVEINGTTVATGIGTGTFETTVDISGDLNVDSWNDITLTSGSLGRIQATVFLEGYSQIGKK